MVMFMEKILNKSVLILFVITIILSFVSHACAETGTVTGKVVGKDGKPVKGGLVAFYKKKYDIQFMPRKYRFEPEEVAFIESNGVFKERLDSGIYYVEVVQRASNEIVGPPREGENHSISLNERGMPREYIIKAGEKNDIGKITGLKPYKKLKIDDIKTGITGVVRSRGGSPVSGAVVFVYADSFMTGIALFASDKTGKDGKYVLGVHSGGTYYISAENMDDNSVDDTRRYKGSDPIPVTMESGQVMKGFDISL